MGKRLNLVFSFVILFCILVSCKQSKSLYGPTSNQIENLNLPSERLFSNTEISIGRRICGALKNKREFFQSLKDKKEQFRFQETLVDCQGNKTLDTTFVAWISNAVKLEYLAVFPRENYFRDIVTDQSSGINDICLSLQVSDNVSNTIKSGGGRYTINFLIAENYDHYDLRKEMKDGFGKYTTSAVESISFITGPNQAAAKFAGVEKERVLLTKCEKNNFQSMKQIWKEDITHF